MPGNAPLTNFSCEADPENPGWLRWQLTNPDCFNEAVLGKQIVRVEGPNSARMRLIPKVPLHTNSGGNVHGAITLALIDVSLFSTLYLLRGLDAGRSVTLGVSTQFIGKGDASRPLDAVVELLRETGRLAFLRGLVMQDDDIVASFEGTVRKASPRP